MDVADSAPGAADQIFDFVSASGEGSDDQLVLTNIDADTGTAGDQAFGGFTVGPHNLWITSSVNPDGGYDFVIYGDVNGDTTADLEIHLHSSGGTLWPDDITM